MAARGRGVADFTRKDPGAGGLERPGPGGVAGQDPHPVALREQLPGQPPPNEAGASGNKVGHDPASHTGGRITVT